MADKVEIERRFIVEEHSLDLGSCRNAAIVQGYLIAPRARDSFRVRIIDDARAVITLKSGSGIARTEKEYGLPLEAARTILEACGGLVIEKLRHYHEGWVIDVFGGALRGLILAEYEMESLDENFDRLPDWMVKTTEVTDSLTNRHLAQISSDLADTEGQVGLDQVMTRRVPRIVLTGGPCSGKSTLIEELKTSHGHILHCVPEVATIVIAQVGVVPPTDDPPALRRFQRTIARVQRGFEEVSEIQALRSGKHALLLDRGVPDGAAYMDGGTEEFERVCQTDIDHEFLQYDLVLCLDAPPREIYEKHGRDNPARRESYEEATALGERIVTVWRRSPNFRLIKGDGSWKTKSRVAKREIVRFLDALYGPSGGL